MKAQYYQLKQFICHVRHVTLGLSLMSILFFTSCSKPEAKEDPLLGELGDHIERASGVTMMYSDSAIVRVKIEAPMLVRYLEGTEARQEFPEGMNVSFYNEKGNITGTLFAKSGSRLESGKSIVLKDSVVWASVKQEVLETTELTWDEDKGKLYTDRFVILRRPDEILTGYGFEADQNFGKTRIKASTGRIKVADFRQDFE